MCWCAVKKLLTYSLFMTELFKLPVSLGIWRAPADHGCYKTTKSGAVAGQVRCGSVGVDASFRGRGLMLTVTLTTLWCWVDDDRLPDEVGHNSGRTVAPADSAAGVVALDWLLRRIRYVDVFATDCTVAQLLLRLMVPVAGEALVTAVCGSWAGNDMIIIIMTDNKSLKQELTSPLTYRVT